MSEFTQIMVDRVDPTTAEPEAELVVAVNCRLENLEVAVADAEALVRELYTGPTPSPATRRPVNRGTP